MPRSRRLLSLPPAADAAAVSVAPRWLRAVVGGLLSGCVFLGGCSPQAEAPPARTTPQAEQPAPAAPPAANVEAARLRYRNVPLLGALPRDEFDRSMQALTAWVAPQAGCGHCHVAGDLASDAKPAKQVARRMLQMVWQINTNWKPHVGRQGVTCHTCHRGQPLPAQRWALQDAGMSADHPLMAYLRRPAAAAGLPPAQQADAEYSLMLHYAEALAADCTHCHDTPAAAAVAQPSPRKQALLAQTRGGVRLLQEVNSEHLAGLPGATQGPQANCATCHQGRQQPDGDGAPRAADFAALMLAPTEQGSARPSPALAGQATDRCARAAAAAARQGQRIPADTGLRTVRGSAPLALYAAPDAACTLLSLPVKTGAQLEAYVTHAGYTSVRQRWGATGEVRGWIRSDRLGGG